MFSLFSKLQDFITPKQVGFLLKNHKHFLRERENWECFKRSGIQIHKLEYCIYGALFLCLCVENYIGAFICLNNFKVYQEQKSISNIQ